MNNSYRELHRSAYDKRIAGVCGGLGEYFNIDPALFRIIFLVALLGGGSGALIYFVIWLIVPEA